MRSFNYFILIQKVKCKNIMRSYSSHGSVSMENNDAVIQLFYFNSKSQT